jgi:hypothetical protein
MPGPAQLAQGFDNGHINAQALLQITIEVLQGSTASTEAQAIDQGATKLGSPVRHNPFELVGERFELRSPNLPQQARERLHIEALASLQPGQAGRLWINTVLLFHKLGLVVAELQIFHNGLREEGTAPGEGTAVPQNVLPQNKRRAVAAAYIDYEQGGRRGQALMLQ